MRDAKKYPGIVLCYGNARDFFYRVIFKDFKAYLARFDIYNSRKVFNIMFEVDYFFVLETCLGFMATQIDQIQFLHGLQMGVLFHSLPIGPTKLDNLAVYLGSCGTSCL